LHITEREKEMLQFIADSDGELETNELMHKLRLSRTRVRQLADRLEMILPEFYVEKRSESVTESTDNSRHTVTQHNYYCYSGAVTLDLYESVVSLRDATPDEAQMESTYSASAGHLQGAKPASCQEKNEGQNEEIQTKEDDNNNIISNTTTTNTALARLNQREHNASTPMHSLQRPASAHDPHESEVRKKLILESEAIEDVEHLPFSGLQVPCKCLHLPISGHTSGPVTTKNLDPEDIQELREADFNGYVLERLGWLAGGNKEYRPETLCNATVESYCEEHDISDRQSCVKLARRFSDLVNGTTPTAGIFLNLTGGKPLILAVDEVR
jgi:hypothetical protein